jgi:hypothetical protein
MSYNITLVDNISGIGSVLGFMNVNASGLYFVMFILTLIAIITMIALRSNMREFKALFFAFAITLIPTIILGTIESFGTLLIPAWYIVLHITVLAITGVFAYLNK